MVNISFVIPCYNSSATVSDAFMSIVETNLLPGDEIILVDDGSSDNTLSLLSNLCLQYSEFASYREHEFNKGGSAARNTGVEAANNEFIFNLDSDNILIPNSISILREEIQGTDLDAVSFGHLFYFKKTVNDISHVWRFHGGEASAEDCLAGHIHPIASGNYLFRKRAWERVGGYTEHAGALDAWFFGFELIAKGCKFMVLEHSGYFHRYGHSSYWKRESKKDAISQRARELLLPYRSIICDESWSRIERNSKWFDQMTNQPIFLNQGKKGSTGVEIKKRILSKVDISDFS